MPDIRELTHLKDLWDDAHAKSLAGDQLALLRYRSNLLGADLRITNFGGGNTSSKFELPDPFTGRVADLSISVNYPNRYSKHQRMLPHHDSHRPPRQTVGCRILRSLREGCVGCRFGLGSGFVRLP